MSHTHNFDVMTHTFENVLPGKEVYQKGWKGDYPRLFLKNSKADIARLRKKVYLSFKKFTEIRKILGQKRFDKIFIDDPGGVSWGIGTYRRIHNIHFPPLKFQKFPKKFNYLIIQNISLNWAPRIFAFCPDNKKRDNFHVLEHGTIKERLFLKFFKKISKIFNS